MYINLIVNSQLKVFSTLFFLIKPLSLSAFIFFFYELNLNNYFDIQPITHPRPSYGVLCHLSVQSHYLVLWSGATDTRYSKNCFPEIEHLPFRATPINCRCGGHHCSQFVAWKIYWITFISIKKQLTTKKWFVFISQHSMRLMEDVKINKYKSTIE